MRTIAFSSTRGPKSKLAHCAATWLLQVGNQLDPVVQCASVDFAPRARCATTWAAVEELQWCVTRRTRRARARSLSLYSGVCLAASAALAVTAGEAEMKRGPETSTRGSRRLLSFTLWPHLALVAWRRAHVCQASCTCCCAAEVPALSSPFGSRACGSLAAYRALPPACAAAPGSSSLPKHARTVRESGRGSR